MNPSNLLTCLRLLMAPTFVVFFLWGTWQHALAALLVSLGIEVTDLMDGKLARKHHWVTDFGKLFDPFADALSRFTIFLTFMHKGYAPLWMILLIFYRDSTVSFIRILAANRNVVVSARQSGKLKAVAQGIVINVLVALNFFLYAFGTSPATHHAWMTSAGYYMMFVITVITMISWVDYIIGNLVVLKTYNLKQ